MVKTALYKKKGVFKEKGYNVLHHFAAHPTSRRTFFAAFASNFKTRFSHQINAGPLEGASGGAGD